MLTRVKTFVATGLATAGRLYAGDLNAIQDAVAAYSDYNQRVDVGTLGIESATDATTALTYYGTNEARLTGALRVDKILRGLGGLYAGQFTTAQRNAIASGQAPYGIIIFNTDNNRYEWNRGTDAARQWVPFTISVQKNGTGTPVSEGGLNFIEVSGITLTVADNPGTGNVDITVTAGVQASAGAIPIGGIMEWPTPSDPPNFLICDGRSLLRSGGTPSYAGLFAVIGTSFGFVDTTHFNIPDFRGRTAYGPNGGTVALAGNEGVVSPTQRGPSHFHQYQAPLTPHGGYTETGNNPGATLNYGQTSGNVYQQDQGSWLGMYRAIRFQ